MGSLGHHDLPPASSPSLILTHPTEAELRRIWASTHGEWGMAVSLEAYVERERYLGTIPGGDGGRLSSWILTEAGVAPGLRPVLSSCDTMRKPALVAPAGGEKGVQECITHAVGAVFTAKEFRGRGYAGRMMSELGEVLRSYQGDAVDHSHGRAAKGQTNGQSNGHTNGHTNGQTNGHTNGHTTTAEQPVMFSVLYSDIGKKFYAKHGWHPYQSTHVTWSPAVPDAPPPPNVRPLDEAELVELCAVDVQLLRSQLPEKARCDRPAVAIVPCVDSMRWHLLREAYMTSHVYPDGRKPTVRGAVWDGNGSGKRMWAVWMRGYYGKAEDNTLNILRVVVEDEEGTAREDLVDGFRGIVEMARREAALWDMGDVQLWNPVGIVGELVDGCGIKGTLVEREEESIASLMWYGDGVREREVEWVANDKFAWC